MLGERAGWPVWVVVSAIMSCRDSTAHLGPGMECSHTGTLGPHITSNTRPGLGREGTTRGEDYHHLVMRRVVNDQAGPHNETLHTDRD